MEEKEIYAVPQKLAERENLRSEITEFTKRQPVVAPVTIDELSEMADVFIKETSTSASHKGWLMVEINNSLWSATIEAIPYGRRALMLPQCLRKSSRCKADIDELGLTCGRCGRCSILELQDLADNLGMMSIVSEGFTQAVALVKNNLADAVIAVACLESLEKAFPTLIDEAVPGIAVPLNRAGCKETDVDVNYLAEIMSMRSTDTLTSMAGMKSEVESWFCDQKINAIMSTADNPASVIAREWMLRDGKRWRPYLLTAVWSAITGERQIDDKIQTAAIAIECFHKASLVHDDIQDKDYTRNGRATVEAEHGADVAINVGDMLVGEGYRLLAKCDDIRLMTIAADAHVALCKGQGMELAWSANPTPATIDFVLDIFVHKTVPAFEAAIVMGAICAEADDELIAKLRAFSRLIGIAYQLKDDLDDEAANASAASPTVVRPSAIMALENICYDNEKNAQTRAEAVELTRQMLDEYRQNIFIELQDIQNVELKRLLYRVTKSIL